MAKKSKTEPTPTERLLEGAELPNGCKVIGSGVLLQVGSDATDPESWVRIAETPIVVHALARTVRGTDWESVVRWVDLDGNLREAAFPQSSLVATGKGSVYDRLEDLGFRRTDPSAKDLRDYLRAFRPTLRFRRADASGWVDDPRGRLVYLLPNQEPILPTDAAGGAEPYRLLLTPGLPTERSVRAAGTLEEWQERVAKPLTGNPLLVFFACAAFAGPLLRLAGGESGGFHLFGESSRGKTTALQVAASVWGDGSDPGAGGHDSMVLPWRATANALEGLAAAHSDVLLVLDELHQCPDDQFAAAIYLLAGGRGKARMREDASLRAQAQWRLLFLSSGNYSADEKLPEKTARDARWAQRIRMLDLRVDETHPVIADPHGADPGEFARGLKAACSETFGTAGPAFVQALVDALSEEGQSADDLRDIRREWEEHLAVDGLEPERARAVQRIALVAAAGQVAGDLGVLPLSVEDVEAAAVAVRDRWIASTHTVFPVPGALLALRDLLRDHADRFARTEEEAEALGEELAGWVWEKDGVEHFIVDQPVFSKTCKPASVPAVCAELDRQGHLHTNNPGKLVGRLGVDGKKRSGYVVRASLLDASLAADPKVHPWS